MTSALQIADLVKRYPTGTEALKGVSLDIGAGEFFGLLGPNGAGKSTLIHCTTGLSQPTAGDIKVFGHDAVDHYEEARLAVGLAPQDINLDWFLTVQETLDYHGGYFGMPRARPPRALGGAARGVLAHRQEGRAHAHAVGRHEAAADPGARADAPAAAADPRRADRRRRRRAAARALAVRPAHQRRGHDDPPHHALPRGGRAALRPDRLHQRRADRRAGDERRAGGRVRRRARSRTPTSSSSAARSSRARTSASDAA